LVQKTTVVFLTGGGSGGFDLMVSDGVKLTGALHFAITAQKVTLRVARTGPSHLHVFPMRRQILTPNQLLALASDSRRPVSYVIKSLPSLGRLMIDSSPPGNPRIATNFTQRDINSSRVFYEHTHPFFGLSTNDSFTFDIKAEFAEPLLGQVIQKFCYTVHLYRHTNHCLYLR
jgi:chondroitin sulfate proteoglycan 4